MHHSFHAPFLIAVLSSLLLGCDHQETLSKESTEAAGGPAAVTSEQTSADSASKTAASNAAVATAVQPVNYTAPDRGGFLGDMACRECHQEINERFAGHPMSRSITAVDPQAEAARMEASSSLLGTPQHHYRVSVRDSEVWHTERMLDDQGEVLFEQGVPVHYAVGSGRRAIAYISEQHHLLHMSPLNWYRGQNGFGFAPSHSLNDPRRFSRRVHDDCLSCHAGRVDPLERNSSRFNEPAFLQPAIGCENCHGPGAAHVEYQSTAVANRGGAVDPIVNPVALDHQRREAVCYQCHLHSEARILRPERSHYDFRPGDHLDDIWAHMIAGDGVRADGKTEAVAHVQQMHASVCFQASMEKPDAQRLGCISCHDPHGIPQPEQRVAFYRDRCLQCHQRQDCTTSAVARGNVNDSCIDCHMPSRVITDIAHTSQTDHRILKDPAFAARTNEEPPKDTEPIDANYGATAELRFFWQSSERLPAWEQQRTRGMGQWLLGPDRSGRPRMSILEQLLPIAEQRPGDGPVQTVLGAFWMQYQRLDRAVGHFEYALEDRDVQANARSNLLTIYYLTSQWQRALELSDQLLQHDPQSVRLHALRADIYDQLGETTSALQSAEAALEMNPKLTPVRQWLIGKYELLGNQEKVSEHQTVLGAIEQIRGDRGPS